jgi:TRAP-type C4-dicarboxylate transport system substrate-binding protein
MAKKWMILILAICLIGALMLPACTAEEEPAPAPAPAPTSAPAPAPAPAPTSAPAPAPAPAPAAPTKTGTLKVSYTTPKGKSYGQGLEYFAEEFEKATDGRYKVETYPSNSLVTLTEALDATKGGKCEIVVSSVGMFQSQFPLNNIPSVTTLGWDPQSPDDFVDGWSAWRELINAFPEVEKEFDGLKLLNPMMMDPFFLLSKEKEIHLPQDFAGMKIGGTGYAGEIAKKYGGASVHQVPPQAYMNMDKGVIDACFFTFGMVNDYSMDELASYMYVMPFTQVQLILIMNQEAWDALEPADQETLMEVLDPSLKKSAQASWDSQGLGRDRWAKAGGTVAYPTDAERAAWQEAATIAINKWQNDAVALGIPRETTAAVYAKWKEIRKEHGQK